MLRFLVAAAGLIVSFSAADAFSWNADKEKLALDLIRQFQAAHHVPSIAVSVTLDGRTVLAKGLDAAGSSAPGGEDVRYHIGSVTKQFTAAAILAMIEDKVIVPGTRKPLTLDTNGLELFPSLDPKGESSRLTVRRLLTMTSNLPSYTDDDFALDADQTGEAPSARSIDAEAIIARLRTYRLTGPPQAFSYSNTNYFVLSLIIQVLQDGYGKTSAPAAHRYIAERLLARAGMRDTGFVGEPSPRQGISAAPHYIFSPRFDQGAWPMGAGDMISTAADMARWNAALTTGKVLGPDSVHTMFAPAVAVTDSLVYNGCSYGMGWYVCRRSGFDLFQHDGVIAGYMASNAVGWKNGSWMSATVLADLDATVDIVELARSLIQVGAEENR
jgi:CubicO group peptidase (beta-lactamase class C family)